MVFINAFLTGIILGSICNVLRLGCILTWLLGTGTPQQHSIPSVVPALPHCLPPAALPACSLLQLACAFPACGTPLCPPQSRGFVPPGIGACCLQSSAWGCGALLPRIPLYPRIKHFIELEMNEFAQ